MVVVVIVVFLRLGPLGLLLLLLLLCPWVVSMVPQMTVMMVLTKSATQVMGIVATTAKTRGALIFFF